MYSTQQHINDPNQYASPAAALLKDMYSQLRARVFKGNSLEFVNGMLCFTAVETDIRGSKAEGRTP